MGLHKPTRNFFMECAEESRWRWTEKAGNSVVQKRHAVAEEMRV